VIEALVRNSTWRAFPLSAAMCNGVFPASSLSKEFAFFSNKTLRSWKIESNSVEKIRKQFMGFFYGQNIERGYPTECFVQLRCCYAL